eukprot:2913831-Heterocapsa_arctica.AAC.1
MLRLLWLAQKASTALAASPSTSAHRGPMLPRPLGPAPARCSYARVILGPHDPPRTEACLGVSCGSTA